MFHIVLYQPEIPPNTGNVLRLAANTGARLHLVEPLGFSLAAPALKRAGLDYADIAHATVHKNWAACRAALGAARCFAMTTKGATPHASMVYAAGDAFVFGPETRGLPDDVLAEFAPERRIRLPMVAGSRSLNLANAVAVTVFEAWRQLGFPNGV